MHESGITLAYLLLQVVRIFAYGVTKGFALQSTPGQYNQDAFKGLDFILDQLKKRNLRTIIALSNNWDSDSNTDNKPAYANWSSTAQGMQCHCGAMWCSKCVVPII